MNWHFIYFLLDILVWMIIAVMLCNSGVKTKSYKLNINKVTKFNTVILTLCAGFFSVLINGIPELGFSIISFIYATSASVILLFTQRVKIKRNFSPKLSKRNIKVGNIRFA